MTIARFTLLILLLFSKTVSAGNPVAKYLFIKNEGQWDAQIFYKAEIPGGNLWITNKGIEYQLFDTENLNHYSNKGKNAKFSDVKTQLVNYGFRNVLKKSDFVNQKPVNQTFNYFIGNDHTNWKSNVKAYTEVYIENVFDKIDFRIYGLDESLKYEYIVKPNGNPEDIKIAYKGSEAITIVNKELVLKTKFGSIKEFEPFTYQKNGNSKTKIKSDFSLKNNEVSFLIGNYDVTQNLIIDPELVFSTYSGSISDNWSHTATFDVNGNLYAGGTVFGANYPATAGVFQPQTGGGGRNNQGGNTDIVISKYSDDGKNILYSTFLGGEDSEVPHSLIVNSKGELVIFGTTSSIRFPTTTAGFDKTFNGGSAITEAPVTTGINFNQGTDIFVSVISENGSKLVGSTFIGGTGNDGIHDFRALNIQNYGDEFRGEVYVDKNDRIYVASVTNSSNFPSVNSSITKKPSSDAVIFELEKDCSKLLFSTYIGGSDYDAAYGIRVTESGIIYVCGTTRSNNFETTSQAVNKNFGGETDAFIVKIENFVITSSTFLGTKNAEVGVLIDLDSEGNVYLFGLTTGNYPTTTGVFKNDKSGQFIHALSQNLNTTLYSTVFGSGKRVGNVDIVPTAFLVNKCGNIYVAGWGGKVNTKNGYNATSTTNGLPITANAYQKTTTGSNYYFAIFEKGMKSLLYGTYFGSKAPSNAADERGDHLDGGTCRFDKNGIIYHSACVCKASGFVDFPLKNAAQPNHNNENCNMAAFKFSLDALAAKFDLVDGSVINPITSLCAPVKIDFKNNSLGAETYEWLINNELTSKAKEISYTFPDSGSFKIKLRAFNKVTCSEKDSTERILKLKSFKNKVSNDTTVCAGSKIFLKAEGGKSYNWSPASFFVNSKASFGEVVLEQSQTFVVEIISEECSIKREIKIKVEDNKIDFRATDNLTICKGQNSILKASGSATKFVWTSTRMSDSTQNSIVVKPSETTTYQVQGFYADGCKPKKTITVGIDNSVKLDFGFDYNFVCNKPIEVVFENKSTGGTKYFWEFDGAQPQEKQVLNNLILKENKETILQLKAISTNGCEFVEKKTINLVYYDGIIPNVITPNNDKKNDTFVIGFPNSQLEIYNNWGKKIFNASEYKNDWGKNVSSGSYYYSLKIPSGKTCKGWVEVIN
jgi:gliding motility-associated-like protein